MPSAWRSPSAICAALRQRARRPQDLCARQRRRPDGRHQPGSHRAGRPSQAQQADRAVRRQRHHHRRRRCRCPTSIDQVKRFEAAGWNAEPHRRPRSGGDRRRASTQRADVRQADDDRLQDHHRLRRADQGRHREGARLAARRRRDRRRAQEARLGLRRRSRFPADILDAWRAAGAARASRARRLGQAPRRAAEPTSAPSSSAASTRRPAGRRSTPSMRG